MTRHSPEQYTPEAEIPAAHNEAVGLAKKIRRSPIVQSRFVQAAVVAGSAALIAAGCGGESKESSGDPVGYGDSPDIERTDYPSDSGYSDSGYYEDSYSESQNDDIPIKPREDYTPRELAQMGYNSIDPVMGDIWRYTIECAGFDPDETLGAAFEREDFDPHLNTLCWLEAESIYR